METEQIDGSITDEMYAVFSCLDRRREQKAAAACANGEEGLLHYLVYQKDGVSPGCLKDQLQVGSGRMADILKRLEQKRLIIRTEDPKDSRRVIVHVTKEGRLQAHSTDRKVRKWYETLRDYLGEEDSRELVRILRKVNEFKKESR